VITQVLGLKQLEYTWLCSLLRQYEGFWQVTRAALDFALRAAGVEPNEDVRGPLMENSLHLDPYPDADAPGALVGLHGRKLRRRGVQKRRYSGHEAMMSRELRGNPIRSLDGCNTLSSFAKRFGRKWSGSRRVSPLAFHH
jgi:hypothetical protein